MHTCTSSGTLLVRVFLRRLPALMLTFLAYLNRSGSISCSCVDLVALLLSGLEQGVDHAAERGMPLSDEHIAQFSRNISDIIHLRLPQRLPTDRRRTAFATNLELPWLLANSGTRRRACLLRLLLEWLYGVLGRFLVVLIICRLKIKNV